MADESAQPRRGPVRPGLTRRQLLKRTAAGVVLTPSIIAFLDACARSQGGGGTSGSPSPTSLELATPTNPVVWPIAADNKPIADGLTPEKNATLQVYNYADYLDPEAVKSFEAKYKAYNVKVRVSTFNDQDEAVAKIRSKAVPFDVYFPGYDLIGKLVTAGLLRPLNHSYITGISNVWPTFTNPFYDGEWRYSVPYTVFTTGIGWRTDKVSEDIGARPNPYDVFWDPQYADKISILDDYRSGMGMVLLRNGIMNLNTGKPADLQLVKKQLLEMSSVTRPKVTVTDYTDLPEGRLSVVQAWSGDMVNATSYLPAGTSPEVLRYWFPKDGKGEVNNDLMVVLRGGANPVLSHLFLNHMLDPAIAAANFGAIGYQPPQVTITPEKLVSDEFLPPTLASATVLPSYFDTGSRTLELPPAVDAEWHAVWQQFKAGA